MNRGLNMNRTPHPVFRSLALSCAVISVSPVAAAQEGVEAPKTSADVPPVVVTTPAVTATRSASLTNSGTGESLTVEDAIQRALSHNPSITASQQDLRGAREQVRAEVGRYPFTVAADAGFTRSESPQLRANDSVVANTTYSLDTNLALQKPFASGGTAEVRAAQQYFDRGDILRVTVSPFLPATSGHAASLRASFTQPFLRGYGTRIGEADLRAARTAREGAEKSLSRTRSALIRDVLAAYYELWYASRALEIDLASLELAREQERQTIQRVELGDLALAESLTFQTRTSELEESLVSSRLTVRQRSITLGQLMGSVNQQADAWAPTSTPPVSAELPSLSVIEDAIANDSIELAEVEAQLRTAQVRAEVAGDALRPRVDGTAYLQTNGVSTALPNAWARAAGFEWWTAYVGVNVELPTDMSRQQALAAQASANVASLQAQISATRNRIASDALNAVSAVHAARDRLSSAERTLAIAERAHAAAVGRFELGQTSAITVQQAEEDLRRARLRVTRARVDIALQQVQLDHLTGALERRYPL